MKMQFFAMLALFSLLLLNLPAAWYTENLTVQVWDQQYRPVQNAQVYVDYQLNDASGFTKTKPKPTNEDGLATVVFTDYEQINESVDYTYTLYVQYGNQLLTAGLIAENGTSSRLYQMPVEAYYAVVHVIDQKGAPVAANVTIGTQTKGTNAAGVARFQLPPGSYNVRAEKEDYVKNLDLTLNSGTGDMSLDAIIGKYSLDVFVEDENGTPVKSAQVSLGALQASTGASGIAHFENLTDPNQEVNVRYLQYSKALEAQLDKNSRLNVVFDMSAPVIKALHVTVSNGGAGTVSLFVEDMGKLASGIESVIVKYSVNGVESNLPTYSTGYATFEAKIPTQPPNTLVDYQVMISDKQGNIISQEGNYLVPATAETPQTQVPGSQAGLLPPTISPEMLIGGVVALVIIISAIAYFFKNKNVPQGPFGPHPPSIPGQPPEMPQAPQSETPPTPPQQE